MRSDYTDLKVDQVSQNVILNYSNDEQHSNIEVFISALFCSEICSLHVYTTFNFFSPTNLRSLSNEDICYL